MYKSWLTSSSKSLRKGSNKNGCKSRDLSIKSASNNSSDMSVDNKKPSYDSLKQKSKRIFIYREWKRWFKTTHHW